MRYAILILVVAMFGCMSVEKATNYLENNHALPRVCADKYPVVAQFIPGKTITTHDTTYTPGDSIPCPGTTDPITGKKDTIFVKCPTQRTIHDSTRIHDTIINIPTAKIAAMQWSMDSLTTVHAATVKSKDTWRKWALWEGGAILAFIILCFVTATIRGAIKI